MPYSPEELQALYNPPPAPVTDDPSTWTKRVEQVANIVPEAINQTARSLVGVSQVLHPETNFGDYAQTAAPIPTFNVGPSTGIGDVILNKALPSVAAWMVPYRGILVGTKALGGSAAIAEGLAQGGANYFSSSADESQTQAGIQGATGVASGILQAALPRWTRALPLAAVSAVNAVATDNPYGAAANFIFNMLPGAHANLGLPSSFVEGAPAPVPSKALGQQTFLFANSPSVPPLESRINPGEFNFVDNLPPAPNKTSNNGQLDLFNQQSGLQLNRAPQQLDLNLGSGEPQLPPSGLQLNHFPSETPTLPETPSYANSGLTLEGTKSQDQFLSPLIDLQSQGRSPRFSDEFSFMRNIGESAPRYEDSRQLDLFNQEPKYGPSTQQHFDFSEPTPAKVEVPTPTPTPTPAPALSAIARPIASDVLADANIKDAYTRLTQKTGFPAVPIADLAAEAGVPDSMKAQFHDKLQSIRLQGGADFAYGDYSIANDQQKSWATKTPGDDRPSTLVKLRDTAPAPQPSSFVESGPTKVKIMKANGESAVLEPRMQGAHVISTVLDEGNGQYLTGKNWNDPHGQSGGGKPSIFEQHIENASGLGESKFLIQDAKGNQKVVGRAEAAPIAEQAGQAKIDSTGKLQSQDLKNPGYALPKQLEKLAKSPNISDSDLASELGHYDDAELKALKDLVGAKTAEPEDVAQALKEQYGPKISGDKSVAGSQISTKGRLDAIDNFSDSNQGMKKRKTGEMGKISPEYAATLGLAAVGGAIAYRQSKGDVGVTLAGAIAGLGLGIAGAHVIEALTKSVGEAVPHTTVKISNESIAHKLDQFATDTAIRANGSAVTGRGGVFANAVSKAKILTGIGEDPIFRDQKLLADGFIANDLDKMAKAMSTSGKVEASPGAMDAFGKYMRGQLADKVDILRELQRGNAKEGDEWAKMTPQQKSMYPEKWMQVDDPNNTNTKGSGVTIFHTTNQSKQSLTALQDAVLQRHLTTPADLEAAKFFTQSRSSIDNFMSVIHAAVPPGERLNTIIGTMGQYMARSHAIINDPSFWPEEQVIKNAMDNLGAGMEDRFFNQVKGSSVPQPGGQTVSWGGQTYNLSAAQAEKYAYLHTPESLRIQVVQHIVDLKRTASLIKQGLIPKESAQLGSSLFTGRKELDDVTKALLGTHTDPYKMVVDTVNKLVPTTRSAHIMSGLLNSVDTKTGLPFSFSSDVEFNKAVGALKSQMATSTDAFQIRALQNKLGHLETYIPVSGQDAKMGLYQGSFMSPVAHAQIAGIENPLGLLDNSFGKGLASFNRIVKETHLVMNPIQHVRNLFQIPIFVAMGGAAAEPSAWKDAFNGLKDLQGPIGQKLLRNGVMSADFIHGDLNHGMQELLDGTADKTIWDKLKSGHRNIRELYAYPDHFVRAASFLAEEGRQLAKGVAPADAEDAARQFMTRRTLDYANVPQYVKIGRNIPFVSMFLGYTHEIMRVAKNLTIDAAHGDMNAALTMGALSSAPFVLQNLAESKLSDKDRKAWDTVAQTAQSYSRPRFKMPLSRNKDGSFNYIDITPIFHFNDFQMFAKSVVKGDYEAAASVNPFFGLEKTPLVSLLVEATTGKDLHTGKEYRDGWDYAKAVAQELLPPHTPGVGTEYQKDAPQSLGGQLGVTNLKNSRTNTIAGALSRNLLGVDYTQVNPGILQSNYFKEAQHQIANEQQYYRDAMMTQGLSADAKNRARQRFTEAVQHIAQNLHTKFN